MSVASHSSSEKPQDARESGAVEADPTDSDVFGDVETVQQAAELMDLVVVTADPMGRSAPELRKEGYDPTDRECPEDGCVGSLWSGPGVGVCDRCGFIEEAIPTSQREWSSGDTWDEFDQRRPKYASGFYRCVGGFPSPYDWVSNGDLEPEVLVEDVDPGVFYR